MRRAAFIAILTATATYTAYASGPSTVQVVSAASSAPLVSPDSLATIYGTGLSSVTAIGQLTSDGKLPTNIDGLSVLIDNQPAGLLYISPGQINVWIPPQVSTGTASVRIVQETNNVVGTGSVAIAQIAPALFTLDCLRVNRGAVQNGVTYALEPFATTTQSNPGADKRTRLSLFGTGVRNAAAGALTVLSTNSTGQDIPLPVEYSGPAPNFFGLDQINIVLPQVLDGAGLVSLRVAIRSQTSNSVNVTIATSQQLAALTRVFDVHTIAGSGLGGFDAGVKPALHASLSRPLGVAIDRFGRLYVADTDNSAVRLISLDGSLSTVAGTGVSGFSGDGGPATVAQLNHPQGLAVSPTGDIFVADTGNNRVRRISSDGTISTFGGGELMGNTGDFGPAIAASLSGPTAVDVDSFLSVLISDTGNNRIRKVTADGLIVPFAGSGDSGYSGDGGSSLQAALNTPSSLITSIDGAVFVADIGNFRVRRIQNGTITTLIGDGTTGSQAQPCAALSAALNDPTRLTTDLFGRTFLADTPGARLELLDTDCQVHPIAGTGLSGYSGDSGPAMSAEFNQPSGLAATLFGEVYVADSANNLIRKLTPHSGEAVCSASSLELGFVPQQGVSGQTIVIQFHLPCTAQSATTIKWTSTLPLGNVPLSVTIPAGQTQVSIPVVLPEVDHPTQVTITTDGGISGTFLILPPSVDADGDPTVQVTVSPSSVTGGGFATGTVLLGAPAPVGGMAVSLDTSNPSGRVVHQIVIPAGQVGAQFEILTVPVTTTQQVLVTAAAGSATGHGTLTILAGGDSLQNLSALDFNPNPANAGGAALGTVTLEGNAGSQGQAITLFSDSPDVSVPPAITVPAGANSATFPVLIGSSAPSSVRITANGPNSTSGTLAIQSSGTGNTPEISQLIVEPSSVVGGNPVSGHVFLTRVVTATGGLVVGLASTNSSVSVPPSVTIPAGKSDATFAATTSSVSKTTSSTISASAGNTISTSLTLQSASGNGPGAGTIASLMLNPTTISGGQSVTGTVTLSAAATAGGILVNLSSNNAAATVPASITIPKGQTSGTFTVATSAVSASTPVQITATSANSTSASLTINPSGPGTGTISNLGLNPTSVTGGQTSTGTVTLSTAAGTGGVLVSLSSNNAAATVPESITIPQGQTSGTFSVSTSSVSASTPAQITATSANSTSASLTINPSGAGTGTVSNLSLNPTSVTGGQTSTGTVTLSTAAGSSGVLVNLSSNNATATVPGSITIPQGQTSGTFTVSTSSVSASTPAQITATSANAASAALTINPVGPSTATLAGLTVNPTIVTAGQNSTGTVTLAAPAGLGGALVNLASNSAAASVPASIVIPEGQTSGTFTITTSSITASVLATITANSVNSENATLLINPVGGGTGAVTGLTITPLSVTGGQTATGTVTLGLPAAVGGVQVSLSSNNAAATVPPSVTIAQGQTTGTFTITTTSVSTAASALITATSGTSASATLTIDPAGPSTANLAGVALNPTIVSAGQSSTATVTLGASAGSGGVVVNLNSNSSAATVPASVVVPAGQLTAVFVVNTSSVVLSVQATITATSANSVNATLVINPIGSGTGVVSAVGVAPASVTGGQDATGTVTLLVPALLGGVQVNLASNNPAVTVPISITIPFGQTTGTFSVSTTSVLTPTSVLITATSATSASTTFSVDP